MKRILITGGLGFIGSNLILELQKRYPDAEIIVYDNLMSGSWKNLVGFKGQLVNKTKEIPKTHFELNTDLNSYFYSYAIPSPYFDVIFHLGANTDTTDGNLNSHIENNVNDCKDYLRAGKHIIYASSASVYGVGATQPSKETDELKPANAYAFSKVQLELYMQKYHKENSTGFRFFNVYGQNERHKGKSKSMVTQILGAVKNGGEVKLFPDGRQVRDFVYVKDVVDLLIKAAEQPKAGIYNLGYGLSHSFLDILGFANKIYNRDIQPTYVPCNYPFFQEFTESCPLLVESTFNWTPQYDLERGIRDYFETYD
jgi:ADP-L-glycero-D-manno-heptose 6-epimerase